ncbi:PAS domain S-box protein, partial [Desulfosarcina sp.]|uniref:PAS domain S-box protein n=1 Tax=Desulfosarcina sp. TaxID=2027861 RepID=UPI003970E2C8
MTTHHSAHELQKKIGSLEAELAVLKKCSAIVLADQGFDEAARSIFKACKEAAGATAGYVALLSEDAAENEVLFLDTGGMPCAVAPQLPIRGLRAEAYRDGKTVYANDFASSRSAGFMPAGHVELKNVMFAPMAIGQHVVGLLILANKPVDFTPRDAAIASICAEFAAIALMKTRLEDDRRRSGQSLIESEDRFRKLYAAMNEGVCLHEITLDAAGQPVDYRLLEVNVAYERITGLKREAIAGRRATEVYGVDDAPFLDTYAQVAETGAPTSFEIHWAPMDKHLLVSVFSPRKGQFATVFTDITHLKVKEEQLRISEEYLATTLDAIGDAVITTDRGGRVLLMNPVAEALTGWRLSEARGNPLDKIFAIYHEKTRNRMENPALKVLKAGGRVGLAKHTILISKDGTEYFIDDSAAPIRSENGDVIGVVLIFR